MPKDTKDTVVYEQDSVTSDVVTAYVDPSSVFNEIPSVTQDFLSDLAKDKFAKEILASPLTDAKLAAFRNAWLIDTVSSAHKSLVKVQAARSEQRCRDLYKQLRSRGMSPADASKASGYNPLT